MIAFQFATEGGISSWAIRAYSHGFPSHVDLVVPKGNSIWPQGGLFGARMTAEGAPAPGVQLRQPGYAPFSRTLRIAIPCGPEIEHAFYAAARSQQGKPYDWRAIVAFAFPGYDWRKTDSWECSGVMLWVGETVRLWHRVAAPGHSVTPRDLMLVASATGTVERETP